MVDHPQTNNFYLKSLNKQKAQEKALEVPSFKELKGNESNEEKSILAPTLLGRVKAACKSGSEAMYRNRYQIAGGFALFLIGIILGRTILNSPQKPSSPSIPGGITSPGGPGTIVLPNGDWNAEPSGPERGGGKEPVPADTPSTSKDTTNTEDPTGAPTSKYDNVVVSIQTIRNVNTNVKKLEKRLKDIGSHMSILSSCVKGELKLPKDDNSIKLNPVL
jgi:hypothetical protein